MRQLKCAQNRPAYMHAILRQRPLALRSGFTSSWKSAQIESGRAAKETMQFSGSEKQLAIASRQRTSPPKLRYCRRLYPSLPLDCSNSIQPIEIAMKLILVARKFRR